MRRRLIIIALALVLAAGAAWWWFAQTPAAGPLVLTGNVEVRQVNLGFKVGGRIKQLKVDEGDSIAEGQSLAALEKVYFEDSIAQLRAQRDQAAANVAKLEAGNRPEEIAQAEATVAEREASVTNSQVTLERAEQLLKSATGTRKAYDDALAAHRSAEARLNSASHALRVMRIGFRSEDIAAARAQLAEREAALQIATRQLNDAELTAPTQSIVLSRVREVGAIVAAGETVFVLSLTSPVWIRSYVSEVDLGRIQPGMQVSVSTDTPGAPLLKGRIGFISTTAEFTPKSVETRELRTSLVYRIRIIVDDTGDTLRQGMPVTVAVLDAKHSHVTNAAP
jgi:HlyD family secretion protein